jgi:hypothetical protein
VGASYASMPGAAGPGGRVTFRVDPGRLYFFDPASGAAIGWPGEPEPFRVTSTPWPAAGH